MKELRRKKILIIKKYKEKKVLNTYYNGVLFFSKVQYNTLRFTCSVCTSPCTGLRFTCSVYDKCLHKETKNHPT